jgi:hypothetical protein
LQDDINAARAAVVAHQPDRDMTEGPAEPIASLRTAFSAAYAFDGGDAATGLWLTNLSGWTLKFRAFYLDHTRAETMKALDDLNRQVQSTAGVHLPACAAAPPILRNGAQITDRELARRLSLIAGMSEQAGTENVTPLPKAERWCVEDKIDAREAPLLYWRNVATSGSDGPVDRLTLMTEEEPPAWIVSANPAANMLVDAKDAPGPLIHQLTEPRDSKVFMFAYYRGRPALASLAPLVRRIIAGQVKPLARYDPKTNTVTLPKAPKPATDR